MEEMSTQEWKSFLLHGTRTAKIATVRDDGRPHVTPVWFVFDGEKILFMTWHQSVKAKNLRRDPRVTLCVDEETPLYSFVMVEGKAHITEQDPDRGVWSRKIARRYMGADQARAYGERNDVEGEWVVRIQPTHVVAKKNVAE